MDKLGLPYPKARVIHRPAQARSRQPKASAGPSSSSRTSAAAAPASSASTALSQLRHAIAEPAGSPDALQFGLDSTALVQEFIPAEGAHIVRVEVLNGKYLYAIKVHITGETFDLCPADICRTTTGTDLNRGACAIDAPKSGITVEAFTPPADAIADVELLMHHSGIDIGGVEYITDSPRRPTLLLRHQRPLATSSPTAPTSSASTPSPNSSTGSKPKPASPPLPLYKCCHPEAEPKDLCV